MAARRRRVFAWLGAGAALAGLGATGVTAAWWWLGTPAGNRFVAAEARGALQGVFPAATVEVGAVHTDAWGRFVAEDVVVREPSTGRVVLGARHLGVALRPLALLGGRVRAERVVVVGLVVDLESGEDGLFDLQRMMGVTEPPAPSTEPWAGLPLPIDADRLDLRGGRVRVDGVDLVGLSLAGAFHGEGVRLSLAIDDLAATLASPGPLAVGGSGRLAIDGDALVVGGAWRTSAGTVRASGELAEAFPAGAAVLEVASDGLDLGVVDRFAGIGLAGTWRVSARVDGSGAQRTVTAEVVGARGEVAVEGTVDTVSEGLPWQATLTARDLHLEDALPALGEDAIALDGVLEARGSGTSWPGAVVVDGRYEGERHDFYGTPVGRIAADLSLRDGVLAVVDGRGEAEPGPVAFHGTLGLVDGKLDQRIAGTLDLARLDRYGVEGARGEARVDLALTGDTRAEGVPLEFAGPVHVDRFGYGEEVRFAALDGDLSVRVEGGLVTVAGRVSGRDGVAYGASVARVGAQALSVDVAREGVTVRGHGPVAGVVYGDTAAVDDAEVRWSVQVPAEGSLRVAAEATLGGHRVLDFPGDHGELGVELVDRALGLRADLRAGARRLLDTSGTIDLDSLAVDLERLNSAPTPRQEWFSDGPVRLRVVDGGVADVDARIASRFGEVHVVGGAAVPGDLALELEAADLELSALAELLPGSLGGLDGRVNGALTLTGPSSDPRGTLTIAAAGLFVEDRLQFLDVDGTLSLVPAGVEADVRLGVAGRPLGLVRGYVPATTDLARPALDPSGRVALTVGLAAGGTERIEWLVPGGLGLPSARASAAVALSGTLGDPEIEGRGVVEVPGVGGWADAARVELDLGRHGDRLAADGTLYEGMAQRTRIIGGARTRFGEVVRAALGDGAFIDLGDWEVWADDLDVRAEIDGLPARSLLDLAGLDLGISGRLDGEVAIAGSPYTPAPSVSVAWRDGALASVPVEVGSLVVRPASEGAEVDLQLGFEGGSLSVAGPLPLDLDLREPASTWSTEPMALAIGGVGLPLAALAAFDPAIEECRGTLRLSGTLGGTLPAPEPEVRARVADGRIAYRGTGVIYDGIDLELEATRRQLSLKRLSASTSPMLGTELATELLRKARDPRAGQIRAAGSARIADGSLGTTRVTVESRGAWLLNTAEIQLRASGAVEANGVGGDLAITGALTADSGRFEFDEATFLTTGPLELDPGIEVTRSRRRRLGEREPEAEAVRASWLDGVVADVDLDLNRQVWIRAAMPFLDDLGAGAASATRIDLAARLDGKLAFELNRGSPWVTGEVSTLEGSARILNGKFALEQGKVRFLGGDLTDPLIDVRGAMEVDDHALTLSMGGSLSRPTLDLGTDNPAWDDSAVFVILALGRAPEDLSSQQGAASAVALAGLGLAADTLLSGVNLRALSIGTDGSATLGMPVTRDVYVEGRVRVFGTDPAENSQSARLEVQLPYSLVWELGAGNRYQWSDLAWRWQF